MQRTDYRINEELHMALALHKANTTLLKSLPYSSAPKEGHTILQRYCCAWRDPLVVFRRRCARFGGKKGKKPQKKKKKKEKERV